MSIGADRGERVGGDVRELFRRHYLTPALRRADRDRMLAAIAGLPRRQREAVVLRYHEDLAVTEIAEALGISAGAVSSALNRAHATLAATMEDRHAD